MIISCFARLLVFFGNWIIVRFGLILWMEKRWIMSRRKATALWETKKEKLLLYGKMFFLQHQKLQLHTKLRQKHPMLLASACCDHCNALQVDRLTNDGMQSIEFNWNAIHQLTPMTALELGNSSLIVVSTESSTIDGNDLRIINYESMKTELNDGVTLDFR